MPFRKKMGFVYVAISALLLISVIFAQKYYPEHVSYNEAFDVIRYLTLFNLFYFNFYMRQRYNKHEIKACMQTMSRQALEEADCLVRQGKIKNANKIVQVRTGFSSYLAREIVDKMHEDVVRRSK